MKTKFKLFFASTGLLIVCWSAFLLWYTTEDTMHWEPQALMAFIVVGLASLVVGGVLLVSAYVVAAKEGTVSIEIDNAGFLVACLALMALYVITPIIHYHNSLITFSS